MELKSRILTMVYAPFTAEAAGIVIGVQRAEGALCSLASVQWGGVTVWQAAGAISHDRQELTEPLSSPALCQELQDVCPGDLRAT